MYIKHLKAYHFPATRSARVKWMLHEVGLCRAKPFRGYLSTLSKRPAFISAFSDAGQFLPEVQQDMHLAE
jgi:hypothetical protein